MTDRVDDETYQRLMFQYIGRRLPSDPSPSRRPKRPELIGPPWPPLRASAQRRAKEAFERSPEWKAMSALVIKEQPYCAKCGATDRLQADHIKPKSLFPHMRLDRANLQTLCWRCNFRKGKKLALP